MVADAAPFPLLLYVAGAAAVYECGDGWLVCEWLGEGQTWIGVARGRRSPAYANVERAMEWVADEERRRAG